MSDIQSQEVLEGLSPTERMAKIEEGVVASHKEIRRLEASNDELMKSWKQMNAATESWRVEEAALRQEVLDLRQELSDVAGGQAGGQRYTKGLERMVKQSQELEAQVTKKLVAEGLLKEGQILRSYLDGPGIAATVNAGDVAGDVAGVVSIPDLPVDTADTTKAPKPKKKAKGKSKDS